MNSWEICNTKHIAPAHSRFWHERAVPGIFLNESVLRGEAAVRQRSQNGLWMTQTGMARKLRHDERYQSSAGQRARPRGVHWLEQDIMLRHGRSGMGQHRIQWAHDALSALTRPPLNRGARRIL